MHISLSDARGRQSTTVEKQNHVQAAPLLDFQDFGGLSETTVDVNESGHTLRPFVEMKRSALALNLPNRVIACSDVKPLLTLAS